MIEVRMPNTATFRLDGTRGTLCSRHRTAAAAIASIEREQRAVRSRPGGSTSYVQRYVIDAKTQEILHTSGC